MTLITRVIRGFRALRHRTRQEHDLEEELRAYVATAIDEKMRQGMTREEASRAARVEMGSPAAIKDWVRDAGWESYLETTWQDVRYGLRGLHRSPGFTAVTVLTLALGIGVNTAVYSAIDAAFLRPLPFAEPERLMRVSGLFVPLDTRELAREDGSRASSGRTPPKSGLDFTDLSALRDVFQQSAAHATGGLNLGSGPEPMRVNVTFVTTEFFPLFGRQPALGRVFAPEETKSGGPNVTVLSHRLWRSQFGGDQAIVGKRVTLDEVPYEVIGVMPDDFTFPAPAQLWVPLPVPAPFSVMTAFRNFLPSSIVARLAPGVSPAMAIERLDAMRRPYVEAARATGRQVANLTPAARLVTPLQRSLVGDRARALLVLMASSALVLLIACANVATLLLSRASARQAEFATRAALGASRARIIRQLLVESVILAVAGAGLGVVLAMSGLPALSALMPPELASLSPAAIDVRVLLFTLVVAVVTGVAFGLWPAVGSSREGPWQSLANSGARTATVRTKSALVVVELALACLLVIGASLLLASLRSVLTTEVGMRIDRVATARLNLPSGTYPNSESIADFVQSVVTRLRDAPGVEEAAAINTLPLAQEQGIALRVDVTGRLEAFDETRFAPYLVVSPGYFRTMGIPLVRGRDLAWTDSRSDPVAVINRAMAQRIWPGEDAIGKRFVFSGPRTVVGIVDDARVSDLTTAPGLQVYLPIQEQPQSYLSIVARTEEGEDVRALPARITAAVHRVNPHVPPYSAQPMEAVVGAAVTPRRLNTLLVSIFGALALCLATMGVYGVLAYSVIQRTREIGVRVALGAQRAHVLRLVIRQGLLLALVGVAIGMAAAVATTRFLQGMLYGITPRDPATFAIVALLFAVVALLASSVPGWRAARVDPITVLRCE